MVSLNKLNDQLDRQDSTIKGIQNIINAENDINGEITGGDGIGDIKFSFDEGLYGSINEIKSRNYSSTFNIGPNIGFVSASK